MNERHIQRKARGARTALVTGGAGFIGCALSHGLVEEFDRVVALDNLHPQIHERPVRPSALAAAAELRTGDVVDPEVWDELLSDFTPDVVIHLAAETGTGQSLEESTRHSSTNVVGTSTMLDALQRHGFPGRIVLASSRAVYGEGAWVNRASGERFYPGQRSAAILEQHQWDFPNADPTPMRADITEPRPASVYAATKLAQEHLISTWTKSYGVESITLRLQNVYGPGQSLINPYTGIVSLFCRLADAGESIPLYEDGEVRRDFILIDDVVRALLEATRVAAVPEHPIDIGLGKVHTIREMADVIAKRYGAPAPHVTNQFRQGDVRHAWADTRPAQASLGWAPEYSLTDGIDRLAAWISEETSSKL